ncbi:MAG: flagellar hook capping FlgD N-terminal domain-containing protein, partial [Burkholderiales bacterium]
MDNTITSNVVARPSNATSSGTVGTSRSGTAASAQDINDRFLTLLITQMKNQDPLSPMDNSQLTSQLSQISTVSGIENLNTTMKSLAAQFAGLQTMQATGMAGRDVMVTGNRISVGEDGVGRAGLRLV